IDRLLRGHVVDFIQWYWRDHYWPTFNLGDAAIVVGAIAMVILGVFGPTQEPRSDSESTRG
ncbi:MAG: signal peptidase II, partial [Pseudomonas sp.]|nr:signal peptidase II [Pseudomonas sp.]